MALGASRCNFAGSSLSYGSSDGRGGSFPAVARKPGQQRQLRVPAASARAPLQATLPPAGRQSVARPGDHHRRQPTRSLQRRGHPGDHRLAADARRSRTSRRAIRRYLCERACGATPRRGEHRRLQPRALVGRDQRADGRVHEGRGAPDIKFHLAGVVATNVAQQKESNSTGNKTSCCRSCSSSCCSCSSSVQCWRLS